MDIYFIRHTKVDIEDGLCYGQSDIDVAETFEIEINDIKRKLPNLSDIIFYSSPLKRCLLLSKKLAYTTPIIDDRLAEISFGEWELKKWDSLKNSEFKTWINNFIFKKTPHGESYLDLYKRSVEFFKELIKKYYDKVAIITHSGVIRSILSYILQIPLENSFKFQIDYGKISKININESKDSNLIINIKFINK